MDGGAWWAAVQGVAKSRTRLSDVPSPSPSPLSNILDMSGQKKFPFKLISSVFFSFFNVALRKSYMVLRLSDCRTLDHQFSPLKESLCAPKVIKQLQLFSNKKTLPVQELSV